MHLPLALQDEELQERVERTRPLMAKLQVDALFLTDENNILYYSGSVTPASGQDGFDKYLPFGLVLPRRGSITAVVPKGYESTFSGRPHIANVIVAGHDLASRSKLEAFLASFGTVGTEMGLEQRTACPASWIEALSKKVHLVDSEPITSAVRAIKSPYEVACLRESCRCTAEGFKAAYGQIREGLTERDIDLVMKQAIMAAGADNVNYANVRIYPGSIQGARSKTRVTRKGDYVWSDVGSVYQGYRSDFSRAVVVGELDKVRFDMYESIRISSRLCLESVRAGMTAADVCARANEEIGKYGFKPKAAGRAGHGIGLDTSEIPSIALYDNTVLKPGMVFTIEPGYMADHGYYVVESIILVTKEGPPEVLSDIVISDCLFGPDGKQLPDGFKL